MGSRTVSPQRVMISIRRNSTQKTLLVLALLVLLYWTFRNHERVIERTNVITATNIKNILGGEQAAQLPVEIAASGQDGRPPRNHTHVASCRADLERLTALADKYELEESFEYLKRYIKFTKEDVPRSGMTTVKESLVLDDRFNMVDLTRMHVEGPQTCGSPLEVTVPRSPLPSTADLSPFLFGVSTTYRRFTNATTNPIKEWTYWLTDSNGRSNGGKLLLLLLDATDPELETVSTQLRRAGIDADVYHSDNTMEMAVRYLTMVPVLYSHPSRPSKKWLVLCDDDTFFPSPHALTERLGSFDEDRMLYIGTLSEDAYAIERHGSQAFGGAGVFLSIPLAETINDNFDICRSPSKVHESNSGWGPQGDILLRKCIYENTDVRLTTIWDLWQMDMLGDPSGFYESGMKPLSVHHYKGGGWHFARPYEYTKVARTCGEDCPLMRFRTADDYVITNGYSVAYYPEGVTSKNLDWDHMERTFSAPPQDRGWNFDFKMGPQRPSLHKTGRKISWELMESEVGFGGEVTQVYVRRWDDWRWMDKRGRPMSKFDGVIELVWTT